MKIFEKVFRQVGLKWESFISRVQKYADKDDKSVIFIDDFEKILSRYKLELSTIEKDRLIKVFPARDDGSRKAINVTKLYDQKYNIMLKKLYNKLDIHENDGEDDPVDQSGYTG